MAATARSRMPDYPYAAPETGSTLAVAAGVHWLRMPLPFDLAHINLWLLEDDDAWVIVDTGLYADETLAIWETTLGGLMAGRQVRRVVATHMHPDHAGNAGWLCRRLDASLYMTREEYLYCRVLMTDTGRDTPEDGITFYHAAGFPPDALTRYRKMFGMFGRYMSPLPDSYRRLRDGDTLAIGAREWQIVVGSGHSPEHACLFDPVDRLLLSGDQVLPTISSNVGVYPTEPDADPLSDWLASIDRLRERLPDDVLVLPAHGKPFRGVHARLAVLRDDHLDGLRALEALCAEPRRAVDVFPALFKRPVRDNQLIMATGEAIAHLNWLVRRDRIIVESDDKGVNWYRATA